MTFQSNGPIGNENYSIATGANSTSPFITVFMTRDPTQYDAQYSVKQRWINTVEATEWILTGFSNQTGQTLANWLELTGGDVAIKSTFVPTIDGVVPGTTVYSTQIGSFVKISSLIQVEFTIVVVSATGTGNLKILGLPFPINASGTGNVAGSVNIVGAMTWPASTTSVSLSGTAGNSYLTIICSGTGTSGTPLQMANVGMNIQGTIVYEI